MTKPSIGTEFVGTILGWLAHFALRAVVIMFLAAVIAKRFEVFAAVGFAESLAWSGGYGLLRGLWMKDAGK